MTVATDALRGFVRGRAGISMGADKDYLLRSRLEPQLKNWGVDSLERLVSHLSTDPGGKIARQVVSALTINETLWFRDGKPFELLKNVMLPDLVARQPEGISVWSAACSSGQEAYSIAMTLREHPVPGRELNYSILGTDICEMVVERAQAGVYTKFEVQRGLPIQRLVKYFEQKGQDTWSVRKELRDRVNFRSINLTQLPPVLGPFDIVFCRNVLIYFEVDIKAKVLASIAKHMRPHGYLVLGAAETTIGVSNLFTTVPGTTGLYRLATNRPH
ncbi:MAG: protein-glutamate O-methyltransferase CheR [Alphaproteobacteria bacterium]|nr:protein-glutamate O-methyltransferase CheR [Alphaproteobacteria bacterium]